MATIVTDMEATIKELVSIEYDVDSDQTKLVTEIVGTWEDERLPMLKGCHVPFTVTSLKHGDHVEVLKDVFKPGKEMKFTSIEVAIPGTE